MKKFDQGGLGRQLGKIKVPAGAVEDLVYGGGTDTVILKGFPADTPTSFPIVDPLTGGVYEHSARDCEVVIRG